MKKILFHHKGKIITCPTCGEKALKVVKDCYEGDLGSHDMIVKYPSMEKYKKYDELECCHCNSVGIHKAFHHYSDNPIKK